jgi:multiple sugar transport system substrate-binding protein
VNPLCCSFALRAARRVLVPLLCAAFNVSAADPPGDPPPRVAAPCLPGQCAFQGQTVRVVASSGPIHRSVVEIKEEFEAATGARLDVVLVSQREVFDVFIADVSNATGKYDAAIAGAWWLGDLVAGDFIIPYDKYYNDPRFPKWDFDDVLPAPRSLLQYGGKKYMVAHDHDGQVLYYRRDLLTDAKHRAAFAQKYGYPLDVPRTWDQFRDIAEYFDGKDLNGDGVPDHGVSMHLKAQAQGMFHFMSFSAPFVIGPTNPKLYWFDPHTMRPLIASAGHVRALSVLMDLVKFGPREMIDWDLQESWDYFLAGRAALTFTWGDLGGLAQVGGAVKGKLGVAHLPGTLAYYSIPEGKWIKTKQPNLVGNVTGGSWAGVISKYSKAKEATYYLLALLATKEKSLVYAARGWDGVDPGRRSHFLPPHGTAALEDYLRYGWDEADVRDYSRAYFENFSNPLLLPYLRIPGSFSYWLALDVHLVAAVRGQVSAEEALKAAAIDFEEITVRLGRERQRHAYRSSLELGKRDPG